jgi:Uma2 family endonuclease
VPAPFTAHLIDGELHAMSRPRARHAVVLKQIVRCLAPFDGIASGELPGGWLLLPEVDVRIRRDIVAPDLAGWRRERMPEVPEETPIQLAPDWVCEVLSPGTEVFDRGVKATWYAAVGVSWLWFADPEARTLEVYANDAGAWRSVGPAWQVSGAVAAPPFEGCRWPLEQLWA